MQNGAGSPLRKLRQVALDRVPGSLVRDERVGLRLLRKGRVQAAEAKPDDAGARFEVGEDR